MSLSTLPGAGPAYRTQRSTVGRRQRFRARVPERSGITSGLPNIAGICLVDGMGRLELGNPHKFSIDNEYLFTNLSYTSNADSDGRYAIAGTMSGQKPGKPAQSIIRRPANFILDSGTDGIELSAALFNKMQAWVNLNYDGGNGCTMPVLCGTENIFNSEGRIFVISQEIFASLPIFSLNVKTATDRQSLSVELGPRNYLVRQLSGENKYRSALRIVGADSPNILGLAFFRERYIQFNDQDSKNKKIGFGPVNNDYRCSDFHWHYGPRSNKDDLPTALENGNLIAVGSLVVIMGSPELNFSEKQRGYFSPYDSQSWTPLPEYPIGVLGAECAAYKDTILCTGGQNLAGGTANRAVYSNSFNAAGGLPQGWVQAPSLPTGIFEHAAVSCDDSLYVVGGRTARSAGARNKTMYKFSSAAGAAPTTGSWSVADDATPIAGDVYGAACLNHRLYVLADAASSAPANPLQTLHVYDLELDAGWETMAIPAGGDLAGIAADAYRLFMYRQDGRVYRTDKQLSAFIEMQHLHAPRNEAAFGVAGTSPFLYTVSGFSETNLYRKCERLNLEWSAEQP
ncbi:MAG: hypothetical protein NXI24_24450 [bacterium]|nr:hypothetical protein [bacterium]